MPQLNVPITYGEVHNSFRHIGNPHTAYQRKSPVVQLRAGAQLTKVPWHQDPYGDSPAVKLVTLKMDMTYKLRGTLEHESGEALFLERRGVLYVAPLEWMGLPPW